MNTPPISPITIEFREAREEDFPIVTEMYEKMDTYLRRWSYTLPKVEHAGQKWLETYKRTLGRFSVIYVAEVNKSVVAFISARLKQTPPYLGGVVVGELMDIWVEPEFRQFGIGEKLTRTAIDWMKSKGAHSVEVQILVDNQPSLNMVKNLGMQPELLQLRLHWENYPPEEANSQS